MDDKDDIAVANTGRRISATDLSHVFGVFSQLQNRQRDRSKGLDLWLTICSRLAGFIDTDINTLAESLAFSLTLLLGEADKNQADESDQHSDERRLQQYSTLIVGDERAIHGAMPMLLEPWSCENIAAVSGEQQLAKLIQNGLCRI